MTGHHPWPPKKKIDDGTMGKTCRTCKQREAWYKLYQGKRTESNRQNELQRRYHLSNEQYQAMLTAQNNACACCHDEFTKTPHVDHDHETDEVRGLLCSDCNHGIGFLGDTLEGVLKAVAYFMEYKK